MKAHLRILMTLFLAASGLMAQSEEIVPGDNLVVEGVPKIPAALAEQTGRYAEFRYADFAGWHPTRREILITTRFAETAQTHVVKFPGGARTQLTFFRDMTFGASYNPAGRNYFVFNKDIGGAEFYQKYRYDMDSGTITLLTDGRSRNTGGVWSTAGDRIAYGSTRRNGEDVDLWVMNPLDPKTDHMVAQLKGGGWSRTTIDWSPDDLKLLIDEYISANESYIWLIDISTNEKTIVTPKIIKETVTYGSGQFSKDGKGIYVITDLNSEFKRLAYIDLATKKHAVLTDYIQWDIDEFRLSRDGRTIAFVTNEEGLSTLHLLDVATRKEKAIPKLPMGVISELEWHRNNEDLGFCIESARFTLDVYSLNIKSGKLDRWTTSETGGVQTESFAEPELIHWKTFDGKIISGFLYRPPAKFTGKRPVIINIHGGPEGQFRPWFLGRNNFYINELGISMIFPNVRGSSGYGKTFLKLDNGFLRENTYKDIGALLDWINTRPDLDADRIMVTGGSYGGHMTLAVAAYFPERIRCALDVVGISNLVTFLENTSPYRRDLRRVEYGDERDPKMHEFLNRIAPSNNAARITKPLFVVQGGNDPRVPLSEAEQMVATVRKNGTPVWYLMAKDEGHGFSKKKNNDFQFFASVLFVKEYLLK